MTIRGTGEIPDHAFDPYFYDGEFFSKLIIENGITRIGTRAFYCQGMTSAVLPGSVNSIRMEAFCSSYLQEITIAEGVTDIEQRAFRYSDLIKVTIPGSVEEIGYGAFSDCYSLQSVRILEGVTSIDHHAFENCDQLSDVTIPSSVISVGLSAFSECDKLRTAGPIGGSYNFKFGWKKSIPKWAFDDMDSLVSITIPKGITKIDFFTDVNLTSLSLPASIITISDNVLRGCDSLTDVYYGGTKDQWYAVDICYTNYQLASATIHTSNGNIINYEPKGLRTGSCGDRVIWTLSKEGQLTISGNGSMNNYSVLGGRAPWLEEVRSAVIEYGVTSIGNFAFYWATEMTDISISSSVTSIGYNAFGGCSSLTEISIPSSVNSIAENAFEGCSSLISVTVPNRVSTIKQSTFENCESLVSVTIGNGVESIRDKAFRNCSSLRNIEIPGSVYSILSMAFADCKSLTSVKLSDGLGMIADYAFLRCSSLTSVTIPGSVEIVDKDAFSDCTQLNSVTIPAGLECDHWADVFPECPNLKNVFVKNGGAENTLYTSVNGILFNKEKTVLLLYPAGKTESAYTIPDTVTEIAYHAFYRCIYLKNIVISNGITEIIPGAFYDCKSLTDIVIPEGVVGIGQYAFCNCTSLRSVTIPASVTYILTGAFDKCYSLQNIYYSGTEQQWNKIDKYWVDSDVDFIIHFNSSGSNDPYELGAAFVLPAHLTSIESEAFAGLPEGTVVFVPGGVTSIAEDAFDAGTVLLTPTGSYAATWAAQHGLECYEQ